MPRDVSVSATARVFCLAMSLLLQPAAVARAQTVTDVLSFLLTNRSIATDDFVRDVQATDTTRATIARVLQLELGTVPVATSASGFTYRLNRSLGMVERTSDSFGPFFVDRSLTIGQGQVAFSVAYQDTSYDELDGRPLTDGSLVATASQLTGDLRPFDVETLTLRVRTRATVVSMNAGLTDRLDLGVTVPIIRLSMSGERVDTYRGTRALQASATAVSSGLGDLLVRGKYNLWRSGGTGISAGADGRLPTGDADNLLGAGETTIRPRIVGSAEHGRVAVHGDLGYVVGGATRELDIGAAVTVVATPRLTLVGEVAGRRIDRLGRLVDSVLPHPTLAGIETLRLTSSDQASNRMAATAGVRWNVFSTWLLSAHVSRPLTTAGLTAGWTPAVTLDYLIGR